MAQLAKRPGVRSGIVKELLPAEVRPGVVDSELDAAMADLLYAGYLHAHKLTVERLHQHDSLKISGQLVFRGLSGLSNEVVERLERAKPRTFGEARRIPGLTPAALSTLLVHLSAQAQAA